MAKNKFYTLDFWTKNADVVNSFKTLFANIRFSSIENSIKSIVVTSSGLNEGKTMVSMNLAYAIASAGYKTLLIDCDLRKKSISKHLNIQVQYGLYSILSGVCTPFEACVTTGIENLYFLDNVDNIPSPPDVLSTGRFAALIDTFHELFDYVIIDTPPLKSFVDSAIIANIADATILVARQNKVKSDNLLEAYEQLKSAKANVIGSVMTFSTNMKKNEYYYAYYNRNNKRVNKEDYPMQNQVSNKEAQNNLKSWLNKSNLGRASKRRNSIVSGFNTNDNTNNNETKSKPKFKQKQ